jgi:hypothetical protein
MREGSGSNRRASNGLLTRQTSTSFELSEDYLDAGVQNNDTSSVRTADTDDDSLIEDNKISFRDMDQGREENENEEDYDDDDLAEDDDDEEEDDDDAGAHIFENT